MTPTSDALTVLPSWPRIAAALATGALIAVCLALPAVEHAYVLHVHQRHPLHSARYPMSRFSGAYFKGAKKVEQDAKRTEAEERNALTPHSRRRDRRREQGTDRSQDAANWERLARLADGAA